MGDTPDWSSSTVNVNDLIVFQLAGLGNPLVPGQSVSVSLAQYNSFQAVFSGAGVQVVQLDWHQTVLVGQFGDTTPFTEYLTNIDPAITPEFSLPIRGGYVTITNRSAANIDFLGYGSSRSTDQARNLGDTLATRSFIFNGAGTAGTDVLLTASDGGSSSARFNGQCNFRAASSSFAGLMGFRTVNRLGTIHDVYFASVPAGGSAFGLIAFPLGTVTFVCLPATTGNVIYTLDLTPTTN